MAAQKICDRPHKAVIGSEDDYLPLTVKQPDGTWLEVDLCGACGLDFKAFLNYNPQQQQQPAQSIQQPQTQQVAEAQPAQPADNGEQNPQQ